VWVIVSVRGWGAAGVVDGGHDRRDDRQDLGAEALGLPIQAVLQGLGLADKVGQATQALVEVAIGPEAIAHQPGMEGLAEHLAYDIHRALADDEQGGGGAGEDPQPQQLPVLLPTGLVGVDQLDIAHGRLDLGLHHRRDGAPGFVNALIDGRGRELQPKPVAQELTDAGPRQAHALGQGADEGHQQRAGQMPLGQLHRPLGLGRAAPASNGHSHSHIRNRGV
jgi:hypothetical protein